MEPSATQTDTGTAGAPPRSWRVDLFRKIPALEWLVKRRWFQFWVIWPNLIIFAIFLLGGVFGSPVGNRNMIIVWIWILWWFLLISAMVPFASRVWCTVCPLPFFGDWLQRRALVKVREGNTVGTRNRFFGFNKRWPKALSNIWMQNILFLTLATFSVALVTRPIVSVLVLGSLFVVAAVMGLIWRLRTFCNYVCPISGFLSLYAMTATLELRPRSKDECLKCKSKACIRGSDKGWACPWGVYMGKLDRNNYCGLCFECVKSCPNDNIALNLRPFATDTQLRGYDEAWKAFIMLTLAFVYSLTLLGPYGAIKDAGNPSESGLWGAFALYALGVWSACLLVVPGLYYLFARIGKALSRRADVPMKRVFLGYAFTMVPLGLLAWIAFSIPLIMVNGSYILSTLSDPMGRGWDLVGLSNLHWRPILPEWVGWVQAPALLLGLWLSLRAGLKVGTEIYQDRGTVLRSFAPVAVLLTAITVGLLKFFIG